MTLYGNVPPKNNTYNILFLHAIAMVTCIMGRERVGAGRVLEEPLDRHVTRRLFCYACRAGALIDSFT